MLDELGAREGAEFLNSLGEALFDVMMQSLDIHARNQCIVLGMLYP